MLTQNWEHFEGILFKTVKFSNPHGLKKDKGSLNDKLIYK